jgi:hypothetical protein
MVGFQVNVSFGRVAAQSFAVGGNASVKLARRIVNRRLFQHTRLTSLSSRAPSFAILSAIWPVPMAQ